MGLYEYTIYPIECILKLVYLFLAERIHNYGTALVVLSIITYVITHPLLLWAGRLQREEKELQDILAPQLDIIKGNFVGSERHHAVERLYKRYAYHPAMAIRSAIGIALQMPFLMAAFYMLSNLKDISGVSWGPILDLSQPDDLLGGIHALPFVMTVINLLGVYTTPGFGKRDKLQALVLAILFLVLLYDATAALLIYWTCNNLWPLLENFFGSLLKWFNFKPENSKSISCWKKSIQLMSGVSEWGYICGSLAMTMGFLVPLDIYLNNITEFWFDLSQVAFVFLAIFIIIFGASSIVYNIFKKWHFENCFVALIMALHIAVFYQCYICGINYGQLDGHSINWEKLQIEGYVNCLIWLSCVLISLSLFKQLRATQYLKLTKRISLFLIVVQVFSLLYITSKNIDMFGNKNPIVVTTERLFNFSSNGNIIVILLDTFDSSYMQTILAGEHKDTVKEILHDFTYYPDTAGMYPTTKAALPHILTGIKFWNDVPYSQYVQAAYKDSTLYQSYKENLYSLDVYTNEMFLNKEEGVYGNVKRGGYKIRDQFGFFRKMSDLILFKVLPHGFKKWIMINTSDFDTYKILDEDLQDIANFKEDTQGFYHLIMDNEFHNEEPNKCFKFYHLAGVHGPYTFGENLESLNGKKYSEIDESLGCMTLLKVFFDKLKLKGIYDISTIIILSDHGRLESTGQNPLFIIKNVKSNDSLQVSDTPITYDMLPEIYEGLINGKIIDKQYMSLLAQKYEKRLFLYYSWDNLWNKAYLPPMREAFIKGKAFESDCIRFTGRIFTDSGCIEPDYVIKLGEHLDFSENLEYRVLLKGFSCPEPWGTWIIGKKAEMKFYVKEDYNDLLLYLDYRLIAPQHVLLYANDYKVADYTATRSETREIIIPHQYIQDDLLVLRFELPNATSPRELGLNADYRLLGLGMKRMYLKNK